MLLFMLICIIMINEITIINIGFLNMCAKIFILLVLALKQLNNPVNINNPKNAVINDSLVKNKFLIKGSFKNTMHKIVV